MQRADFAGPLDLLGLNRLPDSPSRYAELGSSFFHQHVVSLHKADGTENPSSLIDYSAGQFSFVPCIILQCRGEFRQQREDMREIPLTRGMVALIDDEDYEEVTQKRQHARTTRRRASCMATSRI